MIPTKIRRELITIWVKKLQAFWSKDKCAFLKSATLTSNNNWLWFRSLLSRIVVDGKWVTKVIDGVPLPTLWGRWTLDNQRFDSFRAAGGVTSHGGLTVYVDAEALMTRLATEDLARFR